MNAGSHYAYIGRDEYEEVDMDNDSLLDLNEDEPQAKTKSAGVSKKRAEKKVVKKATTNILNINLGTLSSEPTIVTGDPLFCQGCKVIYSNINTFTQVKAADGTTHKNIPTAGGVKDGIWTCEFCGEVTPFTLLPEETPNSNIVDYIIEPAPITNNNNENTPMVDANPDESYVVFCVDVSGSMQCTYQTQGLELVNRLTGKKNTSAYVSRLECVQYGIEAQLDAIEKDYPNKRVAIVSFNGTVTIVGDGTKPAVTVSGDKLNEVDKLLEAGSAYGLNAPISKTKVSLIKKIFSMDANGSTALGPGIAIAVGMCAKIPGSSIVLATDGLSNIGIGAVEGYAANKASEFYDQIGDIAKKNGTSISVLTIKGTETKLEQIGRLAELTSGTVTIVDPLKMKDEFKSALELPTLATNVSINVKLHRGLYISDPLHPTTNQSQIHKEVGNVNMDTIVTFEYGIIPEKKIDPSLKSIPFQLEITYTTMKGMKCRRVMTMTQETTADQAVAENFANVEEIGINVMQNNSKVAGYGDYNQSRARNVESTKMMKRIVQTQKQNFSLNSAKMDLPQQQQMQQQIQKQEASAQVWIQQAQNLENVLTTNLQKEKVSESMSANDIYQQRQQQRNDETATMLFNMKTANSRKARK